MKRKIVALLFVLGSATAHAQVPPAHIPESAYRTGLPEVVGKLPDPSAEPPFIASAFSAAYLAAGKPAVLVLWNREFTDVLQQEKVDQLSIDTARVGSAAIHNNTVVAASRSQTVLTAGEIKSQQDSRESPEERLDLQMRSSFVQTLLQAGVQVIDRNIAMRNMAKEQRGKALDTQQVEVDAITKYARFLLEVLNTPDQNSPTGWATRISVKNIKSGAILTEIYVDGQVPPVSKGQKRFEADSLGGFREVTGSVKPMADAGQRAAERTLIQLQFALQSN